MHSVAAKAAGKDLSDEEIAQRVIAGGDAAFVLLMRRYNQSCDRIVAGVLARLKDLQERDA